jgi:SpoVK/Ycf46/Vps4 family AAA+-type ATPase
MAEGPGAVEARAKAIFTSLREQSEVVIFFDEIDQLILDRDSEMYKNQGDVFRLMTPSMLTKLQDLHDVGKSIFVIGTNYAERIDPAIKRAGRIDQSYLVLPPNFAARRQFLTDVLSAELKASKEDAATAVSKVSTLPMATYSELRGLALDSIRRAPDKSLDSVVEALGPELDRFDTTKKLSGIVNRCQGDSGQPLEELVLAIYLYLEAESIETGWIEDLVGYIPDLDDEVKRIIPFLKQGGDPDAVAKLEQLFAQVDGTPERAIDV